MCPNSHSLAREELGFTRQSAREPRAQPWGAIQPLMDRVHVTENSGDPRPGTLLLCERRHDARRRLPRSAAAPRFFFHSILTSLRGSLAKKIHRTALPLNTSSRGETLLHIRGHKRQPRKAPPRLPSPGSVQHPGGTAPAPRLPQHGLGPIRVSSRGHSCLLCPPTGRWRTIRLQDKWA